MDEFTDVNVMYDFLKGEYQPSAIAKLLNEFETHESNEEKSLEHYRSALGGIGC